MLFLVGFVLILSMWFGKGLSSGTVNEDMPYSDFYVSLVGKQVASVLISENTARVKVKGKDNVNYTVHLPPMNRENLMVELDKAALPTEKSAAPASRTCFSAAMERSPPP